MGFKSEIFLSDCLGMEDLTTGLDIGVIRKELALGARFHAGQVTVANNIL
jgi:hypothetical protein